MTNCPRVKKSIFIFCLFCLAFANIYAQPKNRLSVGVGFGIAAPMGKFGNTDLFDSTSAFAVTGPAFNIEGNYHLNKYVGFSLLLTGQQNQVDTKTMVNKYQKAVYGAFFNISSGDWNIGKIMGGVTLSLPLGDKQKINLFLRIMAGGLKTTFPKITVTEVYYVDSLGSIGMSQFTKDKVPLKWAFAYLVGMGIRYNLSAGYFLHATIDYSAASPSVPNYPLRTRAFQPGAYAITGNPYPIFSTTPIVATQNSTTFKQPVHSMNICVGIGINF